MKPILSILLLLPLVLSKLNRISSTIYSESQPVWELAPETASFITVTKDSTFTIALPSNSASTGYEWLNRGADSLKTVSSRDGESGQFMKPDVSLTGASGKQVFTFDSTAEAGSEETLVFELKRVWESEASKKYVVTVRIA